jgi:hypothetical protein
VPAAAITTSIRKATWAIREIAGRVNVKTKSFAGNYSNTCYAYSKDYRSSRSTINFN